MSEVITGFFRNAAVPHEPAQGPNLQRGDGLSPSAWNTRAGCRPQPFAVRVHQQNGRNSVRSLSVNDAAQILQDIGEASATGDHFQHTLFCSQKGFRTLEVFDIGVRPVPPDDFSLPSRTGTARNKNQRYSPSKRRRRASS